MKSPLMFECARRKQSDVTSINEIVKYLHFRNQITLTKSLKARLKEIAERYTSAIYFFYIFIDYG